MVAIENKIDFFYQETENSVERIIEGSDEHLDMLLVYITPLAKITKDFRELNDLLFDYSKNDSDEQLGYWLPKLRKLNRMCFAVKGVVMSSPVYKDVKQSFLEYAKQHDILREFINDCQIRLSKDDEFDSIMQELNDL